MAVLEYALDFVARGFRVFPTQNKTPIMKRWPDEASRDPDVVTDWFTNRYSNADGFGVCPGDDCVVIDVDVKDGKKGLLSLKYLIDEYGISKNTLIIRTKSGGLHLYYKYPEIATDKHIKSISGWTLSTGKILDGIDIRGNRGQVIGPANNGYSIIKDEPMVDIPDTLVHELPIDGEYGLKVNVTDAKALVYDQPTIGGIIPDVIPKGERHSTLLSLTASWSRKIPYDSAKVLLQEAVNRCESNDIKFEDYVERLDDAYAKFEPVVSDKLQYLLDHLVFVSFGSRIFRKDKPRNIATLKLDEARPHFKNWLIWDEKTQQNGSTKKTCREAFTDWIRHPDRQSTENLGYKPVDVDKYTCPILGVEVINTYRPAIHETGTVSDNDVQPFLDLVDHLWDDQTPIILDWCAHILQQPEKKIHWAPLLVTPYEGMGKNMFFDIFSKVIGTWNTSSINASQFNKSFNTFLVQNLVTLINEVQEVNKAERTSMMGKLKGYITESEQPIEGKSANIYSTQIYTNFIIFSNVEDALHIDDQSRRFFVHINPDEPKPDSWYNALAKWRDNGGPTLLYNWLLARDISSFKYTGSAVKTESRQDMIDAGKSEIELLIMDHVNTHNSIFESDIVTQQSWEYYVSKILHKGGRMSLAQEKYLKKTLFRRVRIHNAAQNKFVNMQLMLPKINPISDDLSLLMDKGTMKMSCWTCRNHGQYDNRNTSVVRTEYNKVFGRINMDPAVGIIK